ncbi:MAG TPA: DUF177 domain-containing protein [Burkholderiaceae bacterium]
MKTRSFDPHKLDLVAFAHEGARLDGEWPAAQFERLADSAAAEAPVANWPDVRWAAQGELREKRGTSGEIWLGLRVEAQAHLTCQRCLQAVAETVSVERYFHFVSNEAAAAELDADSDDDVLELVRHLDLAELIEDELLLALPLVPRHEICPQPLPTPAVEEIQEERPNPFAALASLKGKTKSG